MWYANGLHIEPPPFFRSPSSFFFPDHFFIHTGKKRSACWQLPGFIKNAYLHLNGPQKYITFSRENIPYIFLEIKFFKKYVKKREHLLSVPSFHCSNSLESGETQRIVWAGFISAFEQNQRMCLNGTRVRGPFQEVINRRLVREETWLSICNFSMMISKRILGEKWSVET